MIFIGIETEFNELLKPSNNILNAYLELLSFKYMFDSYEYA